MMRKNIAQAALPHMSIRVFVMVLTLLTASVALAGEQNSAKNTDTPKIVQASTQNAQPDIQKLIKDQLEAIRSRNDRAAYEMNLAETRQNYKDPQSFMRMVRRDKASLYHHVSYEILPSARPDSKFHKVRLTDKFGNKAMAMFRIEADTDGQWRTKDIIILSGGNDPL